MLVDYLKKMTRDPLLLFALVGIIIFILYYALEDNDLPTITLSREVRVQLVEEYEAITGLQATPKAILQLEKNYITDELLFREAVNAGMHLIDPASRASLIEKMRFRLSALVPEPSDAELINYYAQNMQQYYTETALSFEHVYFATLPMNAEILSAKLQSGESPNGDKFVHGNKFVDISEGMLRGIFGEDFLTAIQSLEVMQWQGPISSNHGLHYVRLQKKVPPQPMPFSLARNIIANDLVQMSIDQAIESKIQVLKSQYEIAVDL
jgi:parvulin-like peptidyl-prolyl isomerase